LVVSPFSIAGCRTGSKLVAAFRRCCRRVGHRKRKDRSSRRSPEVHGYVGCTVTSGCGAASVVPTNCLPNFSQWQRSPPTVFPRGPNPVVGVPRRPPPPDSHRTSPAPQPLQPGLSGTELPSSFPRTNTGQDGFVSAQRASPRSSLNDSVHRGCLPPLILFPVVEPILTPTNRDGPRATRRA
jgi:hypothetical protein